MLHARKVSDADLISAYAELGSVHAVGARFGIRGSSAHERLKKLGVARPMNVFSDAEIARLVAEYAAAAAAGKLGDLATSMGRTKPFICRQARVLGLTEQGRLKPYNAVWKYLPEAEARKIFERFKRSSRNLREFCEKAVIDDLGFSTCMKRHFPDEWEHVIESKQISQTLYRFGRQFEYRVRDHLKSLGYVALRSPGSRSPIDIMAVRVGAVLFVQCKRHGVLNPAEWNELFDLADSVAATAILASSPTGRGTHYQRMTARKEGRGRQPLAPFDPALPLLERGLA